MDDRAAKRRLAIKVNATKDGQQKLVAMHTVDLVLRSQPLERVSFHKCIDRDGYFEISFKMLAVKGYKQTASVNTSF